MKKSTSQVTPTWILIVDSQGDSLSKGKQSVKEE